MQVLAMTFSKAEAINARDATFDRWVLSQPGENRLSHRVKHKDYGVGELYSAQPELASTFNMIILNSHAISSRPIKAQGENGCLSSLRGASK